MDRQQHDRLDRPGLQHASVGRAQLPVDRPECRVTMNKLILFTPIQPFYFLVSRVQSIAMLLPLYPLIGNRRTLVRVALKAHEKRAVGIFLA